jgi:hypothetical protein
VTTDLSGDLLDGFMLIERYAAEDWKLIDDGRPTTPVNPCLDSVQTDTVVDVGAIRLHRRAPWNATLRPDRRLWFAQADGRYFTVESEQGGPAIWFVWEVGTDGLPLNGDLDQAFVAIAMNLPQARHAITLRLAGKAESEIRTELRDMGRAGTGRNHPRHVARRRGTPWPT